MAITWTDETKKQAIDAYLAENPTAETSTEIIKQIAEDMDGSPNSVRAVLIQAEVYVKKDAASATKTTGATKDGAAKAPRVSKESQITELKNAITAKGAEVDADILDKLTGKAAAYFLKVLAA